MQVHSAYPAPSSTVKERIISEPSQGAIQLSPFYRDLEPYAQFVNYQKTDKTPWSFKGNHAIDATRPENGLPLAEVLKAVEGSNFLGVGFILSAETRFAVIDLDRCVVDGQVSTTARMILARFPNAYVERSPSGSGLHLWLRLSAPYSGRNRKDHDLGIEVSFAHQYVTVTGNRLEDSPETIGEVSLEDFETWMQSQFSDETDQLAEWPEQQSPHYDDRKVLDLMLNDSDIGRETKALWDGDQSQYGNNHSDCDYHLCFQLSRFTQQYDQIDRLFRESKLMRDKWDERRGDSTYGERTIRRAMVARVSGGKFYAADVGPSAGGRFTAKGTSRSASTRGSSTDEELLARLFRTGKQIAEELPETAERIIPGIAVVGAITELDGKVKSAGKTTFMLYACKAVVNGTRFMRMPTIQTPVVYLTEQPPASFREAMDSAGLLGVEEFHVMFWHDMRQAGLSWPETIRLARLKAKMVGARLLVVDTFNPWAGLSGDAENRAGDGDEAMIPLKEAAGEDDLSVMVLRHDRKGGGDVAESGRGSSAISGAVDIILQLKRPEGNTASSNTRVLGGIGRFSDIAESLTIELTEAGYISHGTVTAVAKAKAADAVLAAVPIGRDNAILQSELVEQLTGPGMSAATIKRAIAELVTPSDEITPTKVISETVPGRGSPVMLYRPESDFII